MLDGTTAFVTGASGGIGRQIAYTLADHGATVACAARGDGIEETAAELGDDGIAVRTDVTDEDSVAAAIADTVDAFGGLDCLVNNAGVAGPTQPFDRLDPSDIQETVAVNVTGAATCAKHAADHLRASERGSVVNIGSIGGKLPYPNRVPYAVSKMGLIGLTRTLAYELGRDDVTVNTVLPGPVAGDRIEDVVAKQERLAEVEDAEPYAIGPDDFALPDYVVEAEEVAEQVAYLAGPHGRHVTAQEIGVDAGGTWY
ncbi:SDR family NAD(P)-dependent oxidoreductase [Halosegnis marinus]|uniref:SDR family NAD(P)-dependent oxidoreductase n=1 Tax=Halosegnis marinus TaxID=3034023 RepID=A0ABD5ZTG7_9EURY|nr:SDR family NAD(P)-dependent oxidoreductase [Halosegnis sp. DT85]